MDRQAKIQQILEGSFDVYYLEVSDFSGSHKGHSGYALGGGSHISIHIVSDDFQNMSKFMRHKKLNSLLAEEFKQDMHALSVKAQTKEEYFKRKYEKL